MLITRQCDYAVRIVRALSQGGLLCVIDICDAEDLTPAFAYKILKKLENAGIVQSYRGSKGGYSLRENALDSNTLLEIYKAVEPELFIISCLNPAKPCVRNDPDTPCKVHCELARIQNIMMEELSSKTLSELFDVV